MVDFTTYIHQSRKRCEEDYGLDPLVVPTLKLELSEDEVKQQRSALEEAMPVIQHFMEKVIYYMDGTPVLVVTSDHEGHVIDKFGDPSIMEMVDALGIINGVRFDEGQVGTNSISLALRHQQPVALVGDDHFQHALHGIACYTAPFRYTGDEQITGTVSIMTLVEYAHQFHLGLLSSAVDSIERELRLQEKNNRLEILNEVMIRSTPLGILMTDEEGYILETNHALEEMIEYNLKKHLEEQSTKTYFSKPYVDHVLATGEKIENVEVTFPFDEGQREKVCQLDVLPLVDGEKVIGTFAQFRDMTSYYDLQKQLIQSEKLSTLGRFGAGLAHEIRNPLTSMIGLTQLLKETNSQNKYLDIITSELERMKSLVNQFVLLGKPSEIHPAPCNIHDLLQNTIELMRTNAELQDVHIHFISEDRNLDIAIDQAKIKQVLINFMKNALEAMPSGGDVRVTLQKGPEHVIVTIQDEGEGMTQEQVDRLGTPFVTSKKNGLGMGLPICFDIIQAHHGEVHFESEKGDGTTVTLRLPYAQSKIKSV